MRLIALTLLIMHPFFQSEYFLTAKGLNRQIVFNAGVIIYPDKDTIPQTVLFFPHERNFDLSTEEDLKLAFKDLNSNILKVYFQGIRWKQKDLIHVISANSYIKTKNLGYRLMGDTVRIGFGIIVTDITFNAIRTLPDIEKLHPIELLVEGDVVKLNSIYMPTSFGVPTYFINYNLEELGIHK
jgi:hypothetical protein